VTVFPGEIYRAPGSWAERSYHKLIYFHGVDKGGHFAVWEQPELFAAELRGPENAGLARKLGASVYIDSVATNAATALQKLGGARVILATAPSSKAMSSLIDGLAVNGRMMVVRVSTDPIEVTPLQLILGNRSVQGWASGIPTDSEDTHAGSQGDQAPAQGVLAAAGHSLRRARELDRRPSALAGRGGVSDLGPADGLGPAP
jgi:hypothetical protein